MRKEMLGKSLRKAAEAKAKEEEDLGSDLSN
jgi:hypothetical protein